MHPLSSAMLNKHKWSLANLMLMFFCLYPSMVFSSQAIWLPLINMWDEAVNKMFLPQYLNLTNVGQWSNVSLGCKQDIVYTLQAFHQRHSWALKLFDSWARMPPSGFFRGTLTAYGDYDQCLSIEKPLRSTYCLVDLAIPMPRPMPKHHNFHHETSHLLPAIKEDNLSKTIINYINNGSIYRHLEHSSSVFYYAYIQMAICMPNNCNESDLETIFNDDAQRVGLKFKSLSCQYKSTEVWHPNMAQALAISLLLIIGTLSITALIYECLDDKKKADCSAVKFIRCFSPTRNIEKLMSTKSGDDLTCIHGLRFLTIVWIIMGHTLDWNNINVYRDTFTIKESLSDLSKQPLFRTHFAVESFFYLSGLLTSYMTLKYTSGDYKNFSYTFYLLLRYLRLTPQLVAFMLLSSLLPLMFDGPLWIAYNNRMIGQCHRTWWHNLIYMQNIIDNENICAIHTWFLAADMQLHWLALLPIVLMLRNIKTGLNVSKLLVFIFTCISGLIIYIGDLPPGYVVTTKSDFLDEQGKPSELVKFFHKPWNHCNVFFIGFIFGAYLRTKNHLDPIKLKKRSKFSLWLLALSGYMFSIYSNSAWLNGRPYDPFWSALIFPLNRMVWALMLTLVIWLCITGNGLLIGRFLSWSALRPLSRMTFSVYLVHAWVFIIAIGTKRDLIDIRPTSIVLLWTSILTASYFVAFIFTIVFESPFIHMMNRTKKVLLPDNMTELKMKPLENNTSLDTCVSDMLIKVETSNYSITSQ